MKSAALFAVLGLALTSGAFAQSASQFPPAPPPPGMNDPGVKAVTPPPAPAQPAKSTKAPSADTAATLSQPSKSSGQERDARGEAPPTVTVHTEGEQTIQEYRRSGQLYMVVVTPKGGIAQTYMVDQKGAWTNQTGEPVKPVMYKVVEWGSSKPANEQDNGGK